MNRNAESRFALNPINLGMKRSKFTMPSSHKTTFNVGELVPIFVQEVLPGDTFELQTSKVVRLQTLLTPVMDNIYQDTYYFFVPNRLVWEHWINFMGENTASAWIPSAEYTIPQLTSPSSTGWTVGGIADHFGIPTGIDNLSVNALPFRAFAKIYDDWFRDENLMDPISFPTDDTTVAGVNTDTFTTDVAKGGRCPLVCKYHDYFTSALPDPQKGPAVNIPVAMGQATSFPVMGSGKSLLFSDGTNFYGSNTNSSRTFGFSSSGFNKDLGSAASGSMDFNNSIAIGVPTKSMLDTAEKDYSSTGLVAYPEGLNIQVGTINQLRTAFALQKMYERDALGGSRYIEIIKSHFGVTSPDYRLQRSEYLGGNRIPLNVNQVVQQSGTVTQSTDNGTTYTPQGTVTAYSLTSDRHSDFRKSFTEHGFIIGVTCCRYDHTYQQGLEKLWTRSDRFDFYDPIFANLGEMAIKNKELYAQGSDVVDSDGNIIDDQVFGYQEAWAEYRYKPNRVTGEMRSSYSTSLDVWHLADDYNSLPSLSASWIREDKSNVDRVLAVTSSVSNQLFADFYFKLTATRIMPLYSVPGLIDHH